MTAEEKRKLKAFKSRMWRLANPEKAKALQLRTRERYQTDPVLLQRRRETNQRSRVRCRERVNKRARERYHANPDVAIRSKRWQLTHPDEAKTARVRWEKANPGKRRVVRNRSHKKASEELTDSYVRHTLSVGTSISTDVWPQALVDIQRENLKLKRTTKRGVK